MCVVESVLLCSSQELNAEWFFWVVSQTSQTFLFQHGSPHQIIIYYFKSELIFMLLESVQPSVEPGIYKARIVQAKIEPSSKHQEQEGKAECVR